METLTTYHSIAKHVLNSNADILHAHSIWMDIRLSIAKDGSAPVVDVLDRYSGKFSSRSYLKSKIKAGEGIFWDTRKTKSGESRLWIYRSKRVAKALGIRFRNVKVRGIDYAEVFSSTTTIRAALFNAVLFCYAREGEITISRENIEKLTGVIPRVQRRYQAQGSSESSKSVKKRYNFSNEQFVSKDGDIVTTTQLPNTYQFSNLDKSFVKVNNPRTGTPKGLIGQFIVGGTVCQVNGRIYFDKEHAAKKQAYNRWLVGETRPVYLWRNKSKKRGFGKYTRVSYNHGTRQYQMV